MEAEGTPDIAEEKNESDKYNNSPTPTSKRSFHSHSISIDLKMSKSSSTIPNKEVDNPNIKPSKSSSSILGKPQIENGNKNKRNPPRTEAELKECFGNGEYRCKIVDLGNACWIDKHFTDDVQTRQYRAPEVILGAKYGPSIDIWSMACIVFELLTGDLLFEPRTGKNFDKNDDHLAQIIELLGAMNKRVALTGKYSHDFFSRKGELRYIKNLKFWGMKQVLHEKYKMDGKIAEEITDFLLPMLDYNPDRRATARRCLQHKWIKDIDVTDFNSAYKS